MNASILVGLFEPAHNVLINFKTLKLLSKIPLSRIIGQLVSVRDLYGESSAPQDPPFVACTVKPVLMTTCIQRPPVYKDHSIMSQLQ